MNKLFELSNDQLDLVIQNTADKLEISRTIVEKDFWVCIILNYLFKEFKYKDSIIFKGGTSLSKVFNLIQRFSEDVDIALDWRVLGYKALEPYKERSITQQSNFNKKINEDTKVFLKDVFLPILQSDFEKILKDCTQRFYIDETDGNTICFDYPKYHDFDGGFILQIIRLEIGCLAEPIPKNRHRIRTYIEEVYPDIFDENIYVIAVDSLRTFYEKITILHREANRKNGHYPLRYSRHYYDVYKMILTDIKEKSLTHLEMLKSVIHFKKKFYRCNWAKYDEIMEGKVKLVPSNEGMNVFLNDYRRMENMLFGDLVPFDRIIRKIQEYESELNMSIKKYICNSTKQCY